MAGEQALLELAVLAAATVVAGVAGSLGVELALTGYAKTYARDRLAARLGNGLFADLAMAQALAAGQAAAGSRDLVGNASVDLLLYGPVTGPASGHARSVQRLRRPVKAELLQETAPIAERAG